MLNNNFSSPSILRANSPIFVPSSIPTKINNHRLPSQSNGVLSNSKNFGELPLSNRKNKIQITPLSKLTKFPILQLDSLEQFDPREPEEDNSVDSYYLLPDFHEFRTFTLSVQIPPDFHRMVKEILFVLPAIKITAKYGGKIFGGILREMIWISFQTFTFDLKIRKLVNYLTQNHTNIWISNCSYNSFPSNNKNFAIKTIHCPKSNTHYQIITSCNFSHLVDATINSLVLSLSPSNGYKLGVRGADNNLSASLDDIKKRRLHVITSGIKGNVNLSNVMVRASILFSRGWKPLNIEDQELVRNLFQNSASALIMKNDRNPLLKENKTSYTSSYLIYRLLVSYYPDLDELINPICHDQIKACYILAIMNDDQPNLKNLLKISNMQDIKFALYIASETGSKNIFAMLFRRFVINIAPLGNYQKSNFLSERTMAQKCLVIALIHDNIEIINYIRGMKIHLPENSKILVPEVNICWHQDKKNSPCNFRKMGQIVNQININYLSRSGIIRN